jgi:gliding motility-associated-like protein
MKYISLFVLMLMAFCAYATHNRAGEIIYEHVSGYTYKVTIITITKVSAPADRPWLKIYWGDEPENILDTDLDSLSRSVEFFYPNTDAKRNEYFGFHTYAGPGIYNLRVEDPNRNGGVMNITNSIQQVFGIQSQLVISPGLGHNNSVQLLNPPTQEACIYQMWMHNPAAYDPDGDSLSYALVPCLGEDGLALSLGDIPAWELPSEVTSETTDLFTIDALTGNVMWTVPLLAGEYNIAIKVSEYRNGVLIGYVIRDMQVTVVTCNNVPPIILPIPDRCVTAGDDVWFQLNASDPNGDNIALQAFGGPLSNVSHPATFNPSSFVFTWEPLCEEIRYQPYQMTFQATDDGYVNLSFIETMTITVVAPEVENPSVNPINSSIEVSWSPHACSPIFSEYQGTQVDYLIYRRNGLYGFDPANCELGVPDYTGYELIATVPNVNSDVYMDESVNFGANYCYMIVAQWPDGGLSYASDEVCAQLSKEVPVLTQVSVVETAFDSGIDSITWSPPSELDVVQYPGPYQYQLYHRIAGSASENLIWSGPISSDFMLLDTAFVHENINTIGVSNRYRVELLSNGISVGFSNDAMSPWLSLTPMDNAVQVSVVEDVPWDNIRYAYYRKSESDVDFELFLDTTISTIIDTGLVNNKQYCYVVKTTGTYGNPTIKDPLINWSQKACAQPYDQEPPCPPSLRYEADCLIPQMKLHWNRPTCADDVTGYRLYYTPVRGLAFELLATFDDPMDTVYVVNADSSGNSIAGCYVVTALDSLNLWPNGQYQQNESAFSDSICMDNCPFYDLPNVYTPNGDAANDWYQAYPYRSIDHVEMQIFNRWGSVVYSTQNPSIDWNGVDQQTGELCQDGVFYYTITIYPITLEGLMPYNRTGFIHLLDGKVDTIKP